jgi:hypothetical protein
LTCEFWAENAKNKCKGKKQKQIPPFDFAQGRLFEDDNKKSQCRSNCSATAFAEVSAG